MAIATYKDENSKEINDRELLILNNLASLDWQFVELDEAQNNDKLNENKIKNKKKSKLLKDLLSPVNFARVDENNPNIINYVYVGIEKNKDDELTFEEKEQGLEAMRKVAGLGMSYFENIDTLAPELYNYELIYSGDRYKIASEYLKNSTREYYNTLPFIISNIYHNPNIDNDHKEFFIQNLIDNESHDKERMKKLIHNIKNGDSVDTLIEEIYNEAIKNIPSRDEVEKTQKFIEGIEFVIGVSNNIGFPLIGAYANKIFGSKVFFGSGLKNALKGLASSVKNYDEILKSMANAFKNKKTLAKIGVLLNEYSYATAKVINKTSEFIENIEKDKITEEDNYGEIVFTEKLDLSDNGFRAFVLKKNNHIIVVSKNIKQKETSNKKVLPDDLNYLRIVMQNIQGELNSDTKLLFTGFDVGADSSFLGSILSQSTSYLYYSKPPVNMIDFVNYTKEDIDKEYNSPISVIMKNVNSFTQGTIINILWVTVLSGGTDLLLTIVLDFILIGLNVISRYFKNRKTEKIYNELIRLGIIREEENGIKGYITEKVEHENNYRGYEYQGYRFGLKEYFELFAENLKVTSINNKGNELELTITNKITSHSKIMDLKQAYMLNNTRFIYTYKLNDKGYYEIDSCKFIGEDISNSYYGIDNNSNNEREIIVSWDDINADRVYSTLCPILKLIKEIQNKFIKRKNKLGKVVYIENEEVKNENINEILEYKEKKNLFFQPKYSLQNEYIFLPFIDKSGTVTNLIQKGYIANVLKSVILHKIVNEDSNVREMYRGYGERLLLETNKYDNDEKFNFNLNFDEKDLKKYLYDLFNHYIYSCKKNVRDYQKLNNSLELCSYNYALKIQDILLKNGLDFINEYCNIEYKNAKESTITFIKKEDEIDYAYNPLDEIIPGELIINAKNIKIDDSYLKAYLKGLLKYFDISNNQELAEAVFYSTYTNKYKKTFIDELIRILSVDKLNEFIQNEGFFNDIKELEKHLEHRCITTLIPYEVDTNKFSLIFADEENDENLLVFNKEFNIDNKKEKLDFSYKTPTRYKIEFNDKKTEIESFNIYSGIGYKKTKNIVEYEKVINSQSEIIVDGQNLAGTYNEVKREDSLIKDKINVIGKVRFFDNNIILLNDTTLVHYYGDNLENKLTITHWKQGDLGITLEKMQVINELIYYNDLTFYHFKINCINYKTLTHLEITKEISNHTKVILQGAIDFDELERVRRNLLVENPLIEIYYGDNQQVIFGGIVTDYDINIVGQICIVKLIAYSTSIELDKNLENKIYHNQGMTYEELINKFNEKYQNIFNIGFNSDLDTKEFLNIERPVEIQHNETDWEFLKRVLSKEKELLITEDTKTLENKTPTLIAIGEFSKVNDDILNKNILIKRRRKGNIQEIRYVINHKQVIGKELFTIGNWYKLKLSNKHEEEMLLVKNRIYLEKNELKSELEFVSTKEEAIGIIKRKENIKGLTLKGVVKKVSNTHRAQIEYINIENEYDEEKSYYYPISRIYDGAYFTPEEESIVEVTFVSEEGKAMITNVSSEIEDISNEPGEKIIRTNYGKEIRLNKEKIQITGKDEESYVEISEKLVALRKGKHNINILDGKVEIINEKGKFILEEGGIKGEIGGSALNMSEKSIVLNSGGVGIEIGNGKINLG